VGFTPPGVIQVGNLLQGEEGYRQWQKDTADIPLYIKYRIDIVDKKIGILEISQQGEIGGHSKHNKKELSPLNFSRKHSSYQEIKANRKEQRDQVNGLPVGVEEQRTKNQEPQRSLGGEKPRTNEITEHTQGKE